MTTDQKAITPKSFLFKSGTKAANSAAGFLAQYQDFLLMGEVASLTAPIMARVDSKEIFPTAALPLIRAAVFAHLQQSEALAAEKKLLDQAARQAAKAMKAAAKSFSTGDVTSNEEAVSSKPWTGRILDSKGNLCTRVNSVGKVVDLEQRFERSSDCSRWIDRRLNEQDSGSYGEVEFALSVQIERIERGDAIARIMKPAAKPMIKKVGKDTRLSFGVKSKPSHAHFSHG